MLWQKGSGKDGESMKMIVAVDQNWAIGLRGGLLVRIPGDMAWFRQKTMGKVVVMGRKTLESLPGGQPLAGRVNLVMTRDRSFQRKGAAAVHSMEEALKTLRQYAAEDVYIIGGESIYRQFLPWADTVYVTKIMYAYDADTFFPNLEADGQWVMAEESEEQTYFDLEYFFQKYVRKS